MRFNGKIMKIIYIYIYSYILIYMVDDFPIKPHLFYILMAIIYIIYLYMVDVPLRHLIARG